MVQRVSAFYSRQWSSTFCPPLLKFPWFAGFLYVHLLASLLLVLSHTAQTYQYGAQFAAITAATMVAYTGFTITTTSWRTKFRKQANAADNKAATVAVDSLINYEAVKVILTPQSLKSV